MSPRPMRVRNAADGDQVARANKLQRLDTLTLEADVQSVMSTRQGRRVMAHILRKCGISVYGEAGDPTSGFAGESPHVTAYNCGQKDIGLWLQKDLRNSNLSLYHLMEKEVEDQLKDEESIDG